MDFLRIYILKVILFSLLASGSNEKAFAQEEQNLQIVKFNNLSYLEIQELELEAMENENWEELAKLANFHISKAKAEDNNIEVARGFYYMTVINEPYLALQYADSIISLTQESSHSNYPTLGYSLKGHLYFNNGEFPLALENYLKAYNLALKKENGEHQRDISLAIAAIRNINGQHYAAAELYKQSLKLLKSKKDFQIQNYEEYLILLYNLSITHLRLQAVDSAKLYALKGIEHTRIQDDSEGYQDFVLLDAQINFYQNKLNESKDTLVKYVNSLEGTNKAIKLYYLGKIEDKRKNSPLSIKYFNEIDSIVSVTRDPFNEIKDVYQQLIMNSLKENDKKKQVEYIGKLIYYDSILSSGKEEVINMAMASYDIPFLKHQKKKAEEQLRAKEKYIMFVGFFAGVGSLSGIFFYSRTRRMKKKLNILLKDGMKGTKAVKNPSDKKVKHPISVPEDIRNDLLKKLETFENSERFLNKDLDQSKLAEELGTNTSYLSVIINHYKQMNFANYLKDLRIKTAIEKLNNDPHLLKFNYQGLADLFGFKTGESFSKAFYQKTGVYPSKFLNELKSRKNRGDL